MKITEVKIRPANEALVKAYVSIVFDNCFAVDNIRVIKGPTENLRHLVSPVTWANSPVAIAAVSVRVDGSLRDLKTRQ